MYTALLSAGVSGGIVVAGLITINLSWRYIYYIATPFIGALTLLVFFTVPETMYNRVISPDSSSADIHVKTVRMDHESGLSTDKEKTIVLVEHEGGSTQPGNKHSFARSLRIFNGSFTKESLLKLAFRPVVLLALPTIFWATMVMSVTIGFLVAISSNFASAFSTTYGFSAWQSGLCFISGIIGTILGIFGGGWFSDWVADYFTRRADGVREPEMRLPALAIAMVTSPLALVLYGCGIEYQWHWIVPTIGLGLCKYIPADCRSAD